jgi:hypothetical protein
MPKSDYIPPADADLVIWHDRFKTAATNIGATLGILAADLTEITNDNTNLRAKVTASATATAAAQQAARDKQTTRKTVEDNIRRLARRLKVHKNYTAALGEQLGIEGAEDTTDLTTAKPKLTAVVGLHGKVELQFTKGKADGVNLYSQRDNENALVFLARDTYSPYVDNRPLLSAGKPEVRQYKAVYISNDAEVGQPSDVVVVTCQP